MKVNPVTGPTFGALRGPVLDKNGNFERSWQQILSGWNSQLSNIGPTFTTLSARSPLNGVTAGLGPQGVAPIIANTVTRFTTVDPPQQSTTLPPSVAGMQATVINAGANSLNIYPSKGDQINSLGIDAPLVLPAGKSAQLTCAVEGEWNAIVGA